MSGFDLVFAMFGLVLGLAVTEVLAGFARVLKMRRKARVGWLTPLLGVFVLIDLTKFWTTGYAHRDDIQANLPTLLIVLAFVGGYYLIATLIFPDDPDEWPDFDVYYDLHNRQVLGGVLAINIAMIVATGIMVSRGYKVQGPAPGRYGWLSLWAAGLEFPLIIALIVIKARRINIALLATMIALFLIAAFAWFL